MPDEWAQLEGGRYLAELYQKDSIQAAFLDKIITAVNKLGTTLGANPVGEVEPPPPINNINVSTSGEYMHVALIHNASVRRGINYFIEVAPNDPNFTQPLVKCLGPSRASLPFSLPTKDSGGKNIKYYVRAYSQYQGSKPSPITTFGGALSPQSVSMNGATQMNLLPSTGSGTSTTDGQQGGSGFGKYLVQNKPTSPIVIPAATPATTPIIASPVTAGFPPFNAMLAPPVTPPVLSHLTWGNQNSASAAYNAGGALVMQEPTNANGLPFLYIPVTPPWTLTIGVVPGAGVSGTSTTASNMGGIMARKASTGAIVTFFAGIPTGVATSNIPSFLVDHWNTYTSLNGTAMQPYGIWPWLIAWMRLTNDGTNLTFSVAADGQNFQQIFKEAVSAFFTGSGPDQAGIGLGPISTTQVCLAVFVHLVIS